jgi:hypothetical protein
MGLALPCCPLLCFVLVHFTIFFLIPLYQVDNHRTHIVLLQLAMLPLQYLPEHVLSFARMCHKYAPDVIDEWSVLTVPEHPTFVPQSLIPV